MAAIYKQAGDTERLAVGEIIEPTGDFTATVKVLEIDIPPTAGIVLATPFFGSNKRVVALDASPKKNTAETGDAGLQMIRRLARQLKENNYVTARLLLNPLRENQKDWNIAIVRSSYGEFKKGNPQPPAKDTAAPKDDEDIYYLSTTNGNPLYNFWVKADHANAAGAIQTAIEKFVRVDNLRTLDNEASKMNKGLKFRIIKLKALKTPPASYDDITEIGVLQSPVLSVGDLFSFEIINKTGQPLFTYIYSIGTDGAIKLFYEPKADGDRLLNDKAMKMLNVPFIGVATAPYGIETSN